MTHVDKSIMVRMYLVPLFILKYIRGYISFWVFSLFFDISTYAEPIFNIESLEYGEINVN